MKWKPHSREALRVASIMMGPLFDGESLGALRTFVSLCALDAGLDADTTDDVVLAVNEVAANSVLHADGRGTLQVWQEDGVLVYEVRDRGRIDRPLAGSERPALDKSGGCGLWLANHLCDACTSAWASCSSRQPR